MHIMIGLAAMALILVCSVAPTVSFAMIKVKGAYSLRKTTALSMAGNVAVPNELVEAIKEYLAARPDDETLPREYSVSEQIDLRKEIAGPENDIVPELKQTGWFRDPREEDEKRRFDKSTPMVSHPLSFRELEKYGYGHLVKPILDIGGPYVVGEAIGYNWMEPTFEIDESKRPERRESYAMEISADLSVGGSLDDKLEKAAELDLGKLKKDIEKKMVDDTDFYVPPPSSVPRNDLLNYVSINEKAQKRSEAYGSSSGSDASGEPSPLSALVTKPNILSISLATAFAFGRCTDEVAEIYHMNGGVVIAVQVVVIGLALATVVAGLKKGDSTSPPQMPTAES